jgi:hypothetical protein
MAARAQGPLNETLQEAAPRAIAPLDAPGLTDGQEALAIVLACLPTEGPQFGLLGDTGTGKTTAMQFAIDGYLRRAPTGIALVVDDKERHARFRGTERRDRAHLEEKPISLEEARKNGRTIIFRGSMLAGVDANPEEVAELAWEFARLGRPTLTVHDELNREEIVKNMCWRAGVKWIPRSFAKGRAVGAGNCWGSQSPQDAPIAVFEQSNAILCLRLAGMGLAKLRERGYCAGGAELVIPRLHGMESPPAERGDFVLLQRGQDWNRKIYKFRRA